MFSCLPCRSLAGPSIFRIHTTEPTSIPILLSLYFFFAQRAITKMDREEGRPSPPSTHTGMSKVSKRLTYDRRKVEGMIANGNEK